MPDGSPRTPYRGKGGRGRTGWSGKEGGRDEGGREGGPARRIRSAGERASGRFHTLAGLPKAPSPIHFGPCSAPNTPEDFGQHFCHSPSRKIFYSGICSPLFELDNFTFLSIFQAIKWPNALYGRSKSSDKRQVSQMLPFRIVVCSWAKYKIANVKTIPKQVQSICDLHLQFCTNCAP